MLNTLLKGPQVAEILNVSRAFAYQLMRQGIIPSVRIGGRSIRVRQEDLNEFISSNVSTQNNEKQEVQR